MGDGMVLADGGACELPFTPPNVKCLVIPGLMKHEKKPCNEKARVMPFAGELTSEVQEAG